MTIQLLDTTLGAGDTGKAGGDKINANATELFGKADILFGGRKPRIATIGNSHSVLATGLPYAIVYELWRWSHADVYFDWRGSYTTGQSYDPTKGDIFGVGGTTTAQMVSDQLPRFLAAIAAGRIYDLLYICDAGYNDAYTVSNSTIAPGVANIMTVVNAALAAGVKLVVVIGTFPGRDSAGSNEVNQRLRNLAAITPGMEFCDVATVLADPNNGTTTMAPLGGSGSYLSVQYSDATHIAGYGRRRIAALLTPYHNLFRKRVPRVVNSAGLFDQVNAPNINVLGPAGAIQGTSGVYNNVTTDGNIAGTSSASRILINDGTTTFTPYSIVTGTDGFKRQRITLGGTAGDSRTVTFSTAFGSITNLNNGNTGYGYDYEAVVDLTGVTALCDIVPKFNGTNTADIYGGNGSPTAPALWPDGTTETLFMYNTFPQTFAANTSTPSLQFAIQTITRTPAGTIDFSRVSFARCL